MSQNFRKRCVRCGEFGVESWDGDDSSQCPSCNDRDIERMQNIREWDEYHPGTPCPEIEKSKRR